VVDKAVGECRCGVWRRSRRSPGRAIRTVRGQLEELAKHYERREKNYSMAMEMDPRGAVDWRNAGSPPPRRAGLQKKADGPIAAINYITFQSVFRHPSVFDRRGPMRLELLHILQDKNRTRPPFCAPHVLGSPRQSPDREQKAARPSSFINPTFDVRKLDALRMADEEAVRRDEAEHGRLGIFFLSRSGSFERLARRARPRQRGRKKPFTRSAGCFAT